MLAANIYFFEGIHYEPAPPTTANWSPLNEFGGVDFTHERTSATLNLSGIPEHALLSLNGYVEPGGYQSEQDPATLTVTFAGQPAQTILFDGITPPASWAFGGMFQHDQDTLTVTLTASGLDEGDAIALFNMSVDTVDPVITVESEVITIDDEDGPEEVTVTATDPSGNPLEGVELNVIEYDGNIIQPQQQSVTTGADGTATIDVAGVGEGTSILKVQAPGGLQAQGNVQAGPFRIAIAGPATLWQGERGTYTITLKMAGGDGTEPARDKEVSVALDGAHVKRIGGGQLRTDNNGKVEVVLEGVGPTGLQPTEITASKGLLAVQKLPVHVLPVLVTLDMATATVNVNGEIMIKATVTAGLHGVAGIHLTPSLSQGQNNFVSVQSVSGPSNADGEVTFILKGLAVGTATFRAYAGNEPSPPCTITVEREEE